MLTSDSIGMDRNAMRLPDFLIIGAAKSGTTTLFDYLCLHPQFYNPIKDADFFNFKKKHIYKEPNFFSRDNIYAKGIDWYAFLFSRAEPHQVCGEATTDYTKYPQFPESAARIAQHLPHVKMIYIMRHPVDRAYSYYLQLKAKSKFEETFEEHIQKTSVSLDGSNYILQIEQYLKFFPRESFLFLLMDDLSQHPKETLKKVCNFIGIDDEIDLLKENEVKSNQARKRLEYTYRFRLTAPLRKVPGVNSVRTLLPQSWRDQAYRLLKRTPYGEWVKKEYLPQPMRPETRQMLLERFHESNQKLAEFLNRDLSHWSE